MAVGFSALIRTALCSTTVLLSTAALDAETVISERFLNQDKLKLNRLSS